MTVHQLNLPLSLNSAEVYPFLGITEQALTPQINNMLEHSLERVSHLAEPRGAYADFVVSEITQERVALTGTVLSIQGTQTLRHFTTSSRVTLLAVTLGKQVATALEELGRNKAGEALFFDAVASAATESLAEQLDTLISGKIRRKGFFPTARFSPGYSDWDLTWQKVLVDSLQGGRIGLEVTPYYLLEPVKSITAAIGWSKVPVARNYETPGRLKPCQGTLSCEQCPLSASCPYSEVSS